ncbi:MAG: peptidylprolyl isomerase [Desulfobacterales bacterium]|jgi:peptidyl-prolyl cis-trans isomerase C
MKITDTKATGLVFFAVGTLILAAFAASAQEKEPALEKAAVVNGTVISKDDYNRELKLYIDRIVSRGKQISDAQFAKIRVEILDSLIDRELLFQESQKIGINVDIREISDEVNVIRQRFPTEEEFNTALTRMNLTEDALQSRIKQRLAIQKTIDVKIGNTVVVKDEESKEYYDTHPRYFRQPEEVRARHILIKLAPEADEAQQVAAQRKIKTVQQKLRDGEDFAKVAKNLSEGPSSVNGGELPAFKRGEMVKPFEDAAFALKSNEISDIVQTRFGYHIIKVVEKKPERTIGYEEIKTKLTAYLKQQKINQEVSSYLNELRKTAKIEKFI